MPDREKKTKVIAPTKKVCRGERNGIGRKSPELLAVTGTSHLGATLADDRTIQSLKKL